MPSRFTETVPIEEPLAELERHLIAAYVAGTGLDLHDLRTRTDDAARILLAEASPTRTTMPWPGCVGSPTSSWLTTGRSRCAATTRWRESSAVPQLSCAGREAMCPSRSP